MSIKVMSMVWDSDLPSMERLVLLAVADFCDDQGKCWPSIARIATKCGMSERGVRKILRRLEDAGWLVTNLGVARNGCNEYLVKPGTVFPPEPCSPRNDSVAPPRNHVPPTPEPGSAKPSRTTKEPSESARDILLRVASPDVADAFIAHRKSIKAELTEHAAKLIVKELTGHPNPDAVLNRSIMNRWRGVFPDKDRETPKAKPGHDDRSWFGGREL